MKRYLFYLLPVLFIAAGAGIMIWLIKTAPTPQRRRPPERAALVQLRELRPTSAPVVVQATGTVVPARRITLQARVGGLIEAIHPNFLPGGRIQAGEPVVRIDPADYDLAVTNRVAERVRAEYELAVERGQQEIARHEWSLVPDRETASDLERELTLRKPHLRRAEANLAAARAALRRAELDLERTRVQAPFNARVLERFVNIGAVVSSQTPLATLVGTDEYWVEVALPAHELKWIALPNPDGTGGSRVELAPAGGNGATAAWRGHVIERRPDLETRGRLAQLIVSVPSPLDGGASGEPDRPLLLGTYVKARIYGPELDGVFVIPRAAVRNGNQVWLMNGENRLQIREIDIVWRGPEQVFARDGLEPGDRLVLTDLAAPVPGMLLQTEAMAEARGQAAETQRERAGDE